MASPAPNNSINAGQQVPGQSQMLRDDQPNQPSNTTNQGQNNFLDETGTQVKNMAQGAADVGKGAVRGVASIARGAALGAANVAQGASDVVKNTFGTNNPETAATTTTANHPGNTANMGGSANPGSTNHPSNPSSRV